MEVKNLEYRNQLADVIERIFIRHVEQITYFEQF